MTPSTKLRSDADWVADIGSAGDQRDAALGELRQVLMGGLRRAFQSAAGALLEDCTQDALVRISTQFHTFRGDSRFVTWALSIATRCVLTEMRRARWKDVSLDQMAAAGELLPDPTPAGSADTGQDRTRLMKIMHDAIATELTGRQREVILAELGGAPVDEIAARLGTNRNALYKLVYDARVRLRGAILRAGWEATYVRSLIGGG